MANVPVQPESAPSNFSGIGTGKDHFDLFLAYLRAKARFELECINEEQDCDPAVDKAHTDALHAFMLTPADSIEHLAKKLSVFHSEGLTNWYIAPAMIVTMADDADRLSVTRGR